MTGKSETPKPPSGSPSQAGPADAQWERAHQAWHLVISTPAHELTSTQRRALFKVIRAKKSERENVLRSIPGAVRKGARIDLADLERGLTQAGIACSLKYAGASRGDQKVNEKVTIAGVEFAPGESGIVRVPVAQRLVAGQVELAAHIFHGRKPGPRLFVSAALHGDEINGTEIIRRLLEKKRLLRQLSGTLVAVPIVNVYGFVSQQRYLPDRRDLNRSFPGSPRGSLAGRVAHTFLTNFVEGCTHGIDLHTGAIHRTNLPQIRARLSTPVIEGMARAFGAPVILNSSYRPGSIRSSAGDLGIPTLVYEAGEALRFDEVSIRAGLRGVISVMRYLKMLPKAPSGKTHRVSDAVIAHKSVWVRAPETGMLNTRLRLGAKIEKRQILGEINDPFGAYTHAIRSPVAGVLIGRANLPLPNEGDALFHIATFDRLESVVEELDAFREDAELDPLEDAPSAVAGLSAATTSLYGAGSTQ